MNIARLLEANRKVRLQTLLSELDSTDGLKQEAYLLLHRSTWHFNVNCLDYRKTQAIERVGERVRVLDAIESGAACEGCWAGLEYDGQPELATLYSMVRVFLAKHDLAVAQVEGHAQVVISTTSALEVLAFTTDPSVRTWRDNVTRQAIQDYQKALPGATSEKSKKKAQRIASRLGFPPQEDSSSGCLVVLHHSCTIASSDVRPLSVPYLVAARKGHLLLKAPENIAAALAALEPEKLVFYSKTQFQAVASKDGEVLARAIEMWDPEDLLFGDLGKLLEAAYVIR